MQFTLDSEEKRRVLVEYIQGLSLSKTYQVSVSQQKRRRSISQNRLYWAWLRCLQDETGNDTDTLHQFFAMKYIGRERHEIDGITIERPLSTTLLDSDMFSAYLEQIHSWAADMDYRLPWPGDEYYEDFINKYGCIYD